MFTFDPAEDEGLGLLQLVPPWFDIRSFGPCLLFGITGVFGREPGGIIATS